jgi:hypothetical protein
VFDAGLVIISSCVAGTPSQQCLSSLFVGKGDVFVFLKELYLEIGLDFICLDMDFSIFFLFTVTFYLFFCAPLFFGMGTCCLFRVYILAVHREP